jgi:electron transfer flavoprotein beta subunit
MTGVQSEDLQAAVTGVMIADLLNMPHCTNVVKIDTADGKSFTLNRELEGGLNEVMELLVLQFLQFSQVSMSQGIQPFLVL